MQVTVCAWAAALASLRYVGCRVGFLFSGGGRTCVVLGPGRHAAAIRYCQRRLSGVPALQGLAFGIRIVKYVLYLCSCMFVFLYKTVQTHRSLLPL